MRPMIKYRGGKSREIPHIMEYIPWFAGRYIEPFFGGGALFFFLEPQRALINDVNSKLMEFYRGVRDNFTTLRKELNEVELLYDANRKRFDELKALHPHERVEDKNEELYYRLRDMFNGKGNKEYSDALLYYYINKTAYSGMIRYNALGEYNVPYGRYKQLNTKSVTLYHSELLQRAELYNVDYSNIFNMCKEDDFVFLDPPYDCVFSDYGNEEYKDGFGEESHKKLANDFVNLPCKALMVIGRTALTEELYKGYIVGEYEKNYSVNIRNRFKSAARHIVVSNYKRTWNDVRNQATPMLYPEREPSQLRLFEASEPYGTNR